MDERIELYKKEIEDLKDEVKYLRAELDYEKGFSKANVELHQKAMQALDEKCDAILNLRRENYSLKVECSELRIRISELLRRLV